MKPNQQKDNEKTKYYTLLKIILIFSLIILITIGATIGWFYERYYKDITAQVGLASYQYQPIQKTQIYSADNVLLAELYAENRVCVDIEDISPEMQQAIIAIEDHRFYKHGGIDIFGTMRAFVENIRNHAVVQGGSTITQQLARHLFLTYERTYERKLKEAALAIALEQKYTKQEILSMYLNEIYFGSGYYGVETAAQHYFGKPAAQLNLAESTLLAAVPNQPSQYELHGHLDNAIKRQRAILNRMVGLGMISMEQYATALQQEIKVLPPTELNFKHPYFTSVAIDQLEELIGHENIYKGGLVVHTTLNTQMQQQAEITVSQAMDTFKQRGIGASNLALVSVVPRTGAVASLVGGVDFATDQNNLAVTPRQPGSTIKPFVYAAALDAGIINMHSRLNAASKSFNGYLIKGSSTSTGSVSLPEAIRRSLNVPVAEVVNKMSFDRTINYLKNFGITTITENDRNFAALALGGMYHGIKPLEMATGYAVFGNQGLYNKPYFIETVKDINGIVIFQHQPKPSRVISAQAANNMHQMLKNVVSGGTGSYARIPWESAGKTGTTDDNRCLWFVGYTNNLATAIWVGNNDNRPVYGAGSGGAVAGPVWKQYMMAVIEKGYVEKPAKMAYTPPPAKPPETPAVTQPPVVEQPKTEPEAQPKPATEPPPQQTAQPVTEPVDQQSEPSVEESEVTPQPEQVESEAVTE
ncbi:PBP1A family penicillin-binding protein [Peptococcaceae bacterium 1198_IL3148]